MKHGEKAIYIKVMSKEKTVMTDYTMIRSVMICADGPMPPVKAKLDVTEILHVRVYKFFLKDREKLIEAGDF